MRIKLLVLLAIFAVGAVLPMEGVVRQRSTKNPPLEKLRRQEIDDYLKNLKPVKAPTGEHQVYIGPFDKAYRPMTSSLKEQTKASYSYHTASNGSRTFDGPFVYASYQCDGHWATVIAKGQFRNNLQVGTWVFKIFRSYGSNDGMDKTVKLNFGDNGLLNGPVEESSKWDSYGKTWSDYRKVEMVNGRPHGEFKSIRSEKEITGAFLDGKPVGKWTSSEYFGDIKQDPNSDLWIAKKQNPQTGDITVVEDELYSILYDHALGSWNFDFKEYLMRGSQYVDGLQKRAEYDAYAKRVRESSQNQAKSELNETKVESEDTKLVRQKDKVYNSQDVGVQAEFPGGQAAMYKWLKDHVENFKGTSGQVVVMFTVDADGRVGDAQVVKSGGSVLDEEAVRVVCSMPSWTPASIAGKNVRQRLVLPIIFKAQQL